MTTERSTVQVLEAARERIAPEDRWLQGAEAQTASGRYVEASDPDAVRFCLGGAVTAAGLRCCSIPNRETPVALLLMDAAETTHGLGPWNDSHTHGEVLEALDRAIVLAKEAASA